MGRTKAVIVGVSKYTIAGAGDLPFCQNDIRAIFDAFVQGLNVLPEDILVCGERGTVFLRDFERSLRDFSKTISADDKLLFFFSGHGTHRSRTSFLVFTDKLYPTQDLISAMEAIPAQSKVLFLDCCHAGGFEVDGSAVFDADAAVEEFVGRGCAVIAASSVQQVSRKRPDMQISLFTSFLCDALLSRCTIREGRKSLYDIHKLLLLMQELWNKSRPSMMQTPVYRANLGGTVFFDVEEYHPYPVRQYHYETDAYIICSVRASHTIAKRYSVEVILKRPVTLSEIAAVNREMIDRVKYLDIYCGQRDEACWKGKPANIIFGFFGLSETDLKNHNYICRTTWTDERQDRHWWYKTGANCEIIGDIWFSINPHYDFLKGYIAEHTGEGDKLIGETKEIIHRLITLAEEVIAAYNGFRNGEKDETELIGEIGALAPEIQTLYLRETNLDIPPDDLTEWSSHCSAIAGCIQDMVLFYSNNTYLKRSRENRTACMDMTIRRYYKDLDKLRELEQTL